jgi:NAD(P)-dependent dehydrogenase (short-subunit alcohol dehydrogenase family)
MTRKLEGKIAVVTGCTDLDRLYETVSKVKGRIDIVFANAGVGELFTLWGRQRCEIHDSLVELSSDCQNERMPIENQNMLIFRAI